MGIWLSSGPGAARRSCDDRSCDACEFFRTGLKVQRFLKLIIITSGDGLIVSLFRTHKKYNSIV